MAIISAIALILLTLVGYSSGVTLASRKQPFLPTVLDLLLALVLWVAVFWLRGFMNHWLLVGIGLLLGLVFGFTATAVRLAQADTRFEIPESELPEHARERVETTVASNILRRLWQQWNDFAAIMGNVQARLIMGVFYFIFVTPFGLGLRIFSDPLQIKRPDSPSSWVAKQATDITINDAKEQG